ncbi:hypothetical protein F4778DRAFT_781115 [Xylariomycetidae sp. FL2044]|nr:hypothetical protein F4778DRAFT_781115 [Xylariomycetidae sp. FL2044]
MSTGSWRYQFTSPAAPVASGKSGKSGKSSDGVVTWQEEYIYCGVCIAALIALISLLYLYDGKLEPQWNSDLQYSTLVVAVMSVYRIALAGIVETCISQAAWIWVSGFRKGRTEARLEDFKMFDEASKGLVGSLQLLWHMRFRHFACIGAAITILITGFETFSSQMVQYDEGPTVYFDRDNMNALPAPPPPRAERWHNVVPTAFGDDPDLGLSTKAAIYDGIIASTIGTMPIFCSTANCSWPIFPTLAVCGNCSEAHHNEHFTVAPTDGSLEALNASSQAFFSTFDLLSVAKTPARTSVQAYSCGLWFCLQSYSVIVTNGIQNSTLLANWSKTGFDGETNAHFDEYAFLDIPPELKANNQTRYSIPTDSIGALRSFMNALMLGNASEIGGVINYSSDWVQAMQNATSDLPGWMSRLTLSLTNDIRSSGTVDTSKMFDYSGTAYILASHIRVNWYWVMYPVILMILAFLNLVQTVWRTAHDHVCAWKGDSLPMLFCHVQKSIHALVGDGMDMPEGLNESVGKAEVELIRKENGQWFFREPQNH